MDAHNLENGFFIALLALAILFTWLILQPYLGALVIAGTLAFIFRPLYRGLLHVVRYKSISALLVVFIALLVVFIPIGFFAFRIIGETTSLYVSLTSHGGYDLGAFVTRFLRSSFTNVQIPNISLNFNDLAQSGLNWFLQNLQSFFSGFISLFFQTFLVLLGLFYLLTEGNRINEWILDLAPLSHKYTEQILREVEAVAESVIEGTLVVAILQGLVVGVGFFLFHIPDPAFWGTLTVIASIIPVIGTWIVAVPGIAYLLFTGQTVAGIGLAIWSLLLVNLVADFFTPQFVHRKSSIHPFVILLSVFGGLSLFGPIGFLMGPLIVALLFSLLKIYPELILKRKS